MTQPKPPPASTPSTPISIPTSSARRRSPPLGRNLSKRTPPRRPPVLSTSPPPPPPPFIFFPAATAVPQLPATDAVPGTHDAFCFDAVKTALKDIEKAISAKVNVSFKFKVSGAKGKRRARCVVDAEKGDVAAIRVETNINDLPDEILLAVFGTLHDSFGFRPTQTPTGPRWYTPPFRISLVCRRWLPLCRSIFYRNITVHRLSRVAPLLKTLSYPTIACFVRRISINIPGDGIAIYKPTGSPPPSSEADEFDYVSTSPAEKLRALIQRCPNLVRIDVAGHDPSSLFVTPTRSSLPQLHQLHLSTVAHLSISASITQPPLTSQLRAALLSLTHLKSLAIQGFVSDDTSPLSLLPIPSSTHHGTIRHLPLRAAKLPLQSLTLVDSSFSPSDLHALLSHITPGTLANLSITEVYTPPPAGEPDRSPTLLALPPLATPFLTSLRSFRAVLYNYPVVFVGQSDSAEEHELIGTSQLLDSLLPLLPRLEALEMGGAICSSEVLRGAMPTGVKKLVLRGCPALGPSVVREFLDDVARGKRELGAGGERRRKGSTKVGPGWEAVSSLVRLEVGGGEMCGWGEPGEKWKVQRACWEAGVVWKGW